MTSLGSKTKFEHPPIEDFAPMKPTVWNKSLDPTGYLMVEKYDGIRLIWTGEKFLTREGNEIYAPKRIIDSMPPFPLDGELWSPTYPRQIVSGIGHRYLDPNEYPDKWEQHDMVFVVFELPTYDGPIEERIEAMNHLLDGIPNIIIAEYTVCNGYKHLEDTVTKIVSNGGEGVVLRRPGTPYVPGKIVSLKRSVALKVKPYYDAEAIVREHTIGKLSILCELPDGKRFSIGSGFKEDEPLPPIDSVITFKYSDLSDGGLPNPGSFKDISDRKWETVVKEFTGLENTPISTIGMVDTKSKSKKKSAKKTTKKKKKSTKKEKKMSSELLKDGDYYVLIIDETNTFKFWGAVRRDAVVHIHYGRIGTAGSFIEKDFSGDEEAAQKYLDKKMKEKTRKYKKPSNYPDCEPCQKFA